MGSGLVQTAREVTVLNLETADLGDIKISAGGKILGKLLKSPGDVPIAGAQVQISQSNLLVRTDTSGAFTFENLADGLYRVECPQYGADSFIGIDAGDTKELVLRVGAGKINGRVTRGGKPMGSSIRAVLYGYGQSIMRYSNTQSGVGTFTMENLPPGRWEFQVVATGNETVAVREFVTIPEDGSPVEKEFRLPAGRLQVIVTDAADQPVDNAQVYVRSQTPATAALQPELFTAVTAGGEAVFAALAPGT